MSAIYNQVQTTAGKKHSLWLDIDLEKLRRNSDRLRAELDLGVGMLAVVKANAYGHGMFPCAAALESRVEYFGVSNLKEAASLREKGITKPILIFGFPSADDVPLCIQLDLTLSISDPAQAEEMHKAVLAASGEAKLKVHVKIDTGMGRLGLDYRSALGDILKFREFSSLDFEGIFTHFAASDRKEPSFTTFTREQVVRFERLIVQLEREDKVFRWRHAANSGGLLNFKDSHLNLVRPGLALYGLYETSDSRKELEPILSWKTRVGLIKDLEPGDTVGYNRRFTAKEAVKVAVLPVGYSHGYPFSLSSKGRVLIRGKSFPIAGQVSMDYTVIDLGSSSAIQEGDEAVLIGSSGESSVTAGELARLAETIPYEIVTRLNSSIPRFYTE